MPRSQVSQSATAASVLPIMVGALLMLGGAALPLLPEDLRAKLFLPWSSLALNFLGVVLLGTGAILSRNLLRALQKNLVSADRYLREMAVGDWKRASYVQKREMDDPDLSEAAALLTDRVDQTLQIFQQVDANTRALPQLPPSSDHDLYAELINVAFDRIRQGLSGLEAQNAELERRIDNELDAFRRGGHWAYMNANGALLELGHLLAEELGQSRQPSEGIYLTDVLSPANNGSDAEDDRVAFTQALQEAQVSWQGKLNLSIQDGTVKCFQVMVGGSSRSGSGEDEAAAVRYVAVLMPAGESPARREALEAELGSLQQELKQAREQLTQAQQAKQNALKAQSEARRRLAENEARLEAMDEAVLVCETDTQGQILRVNQAFCERTGYSQQELIGQSPRLLKSDDQPDSLFEDLVQTVAAGTPWRGELKSRTQGGSFFWMGVTIVPVQNNRGEHVRYIGNGFVRTSQQQRAEKTRAELDRSVQHEKELRQTVKELQQANEDLRASQVRLNDRITALDQSAFSVELDVNGTITHVNERFCRLIGFSAASLEGQAFSALLPSSHEEQRFRHIWSQLKHGEGWRGRLALQTAAGERRETKLGFTPGGSSVDQQPERYIILGMPLLEPSEAPAEPPATTSSSAVVMEDQSGQWQAFYETVAEEVDAMRADFDARLDAKNAELERLRKRLRSM